MRIIVDVMGGDRAPEETVKGVIQASKELNASFILVGNRNDIERIAAENDFDLRKMDIVHTESVITMEDDPLCVVRGKQDSSMAVGLRMLAEGHGDAFVSTGNTGALFTGATLIVRKVKGIQRAGIGSIIPLQNPVLLLDCGANVTVTDENLEQFGVIGSAYMKKMYGIESPRVGLLNNGAEECKGTELQKAAYQRLAQNPEINFVGNIEGNVLAFDSCDVIVADGFTGNVVLKSMEGLGKLLLGKIKEMFYSTPVTKLAALSMKKQIGVMKKQFDSSEHGGSPILGISRPVIKAHGSSDAKAFKNAIRQAINYANSGAIYDIAASAQAHAARKKAAKESEQNSEKTE
ncbi:MAG: phosphate acyltransferase PlsX [Clostridia bacterium]|nr:phosphate acyltransferase PlsX [Clostridia bacterium]